MPERKTKKKAAVVGVESYSMPAEMITGPLFPPLPQSEPYKISFGTFDWEVGCASPLSLPSQKSNSKQCGLDIRHFDLIAVLAKEFFLNNLGNAADPDLRYRWSISFNNLLARMGRSAGKKNYDLTKSLLNDLMNTWMQVVYRDASGDPQCKIVFRAISGVHFKINQKKEFLDTINIAPEFGDFLSQVRVFLTYRLDVKNSMPSLLAQSLYTYLPSRAVHHDKANPWEITLCRLFTELKLNIPKTKSERKKVLVQNKNPIIQQLDGAELSDDRVLRCAITQTKDKKDYKLGAWIEVQKREKQMLSSSKLFSWWVDGGRTPEVYYKVVQNRPELNMYETDCLENAGLSVGKDLAYFRLVKGLMDSIPGCMFEDICVELKDRALSQKIDHPASYFKQMVINAFKIPGEQMELF